MTHEEFSDQTKFMRMDERTLKALQEVLGEQNIAFYGEGERKGIMVDMGIILTMPLAEFKKKYVQAIIKVNG